MARLEIEGDWGGGPARERAAMAADYFKDPPRKVKPPTRSNWLAPRVRSGAFTGVPSRDRLRKSGDDYATLRSPCRAGWVQVLWVLLGAALLTSRPAFADVTLAEVAAGIASPTDIQNARDGSGRLFLVQQTGQIKVLKSGAVLPTAFLDISSLVLSGGERGLLGLAFHPDYRNNGLFYVNYTRQPDGATVVARYTRSAANPDVADGQSGQVLLTIAQPFSNHNGGALRFGPDGYLYIGMGDGGSGNDPQNYAQNLTSLLGKMLRIDVNTTGANTPYGIPPDNPFAGSPSVRAEIWAYGLRNPWRFSFDREGGHLYIGDVGQGAREEIDFVRAGTPGGMNFGWRVMEGTLCTNLGGGPPCGDASLVRPIFEYDHGQGCSVTGGYLYRGRGVSELLPAPPVAGQLFGGVYVYGDLCRGTIWRLSANAAGGVSNAVLLASGLSITTFGEDEAGELHVADARAGKIYRFVSPPAPPAIVSVTAGVASVTITFTAPAATGGLAITEYRATCASSDGGVTRSQVAGAGATAIQVTGLTTGKRYTCTVTASNSVGVGQSSAATGVVMPFDITSILNLLLDN